MGRSFLSSAGELGISFNRLMVVSEVQITGSWYPLPLIGVGKCWADLKRANSPAVSMLGRIWWECYFLAAIFSVRSLGGHSLSLLRA